ncbi:DUF6612 family protein [Pallidibacillus pasinlerensis]|uniref:DUF4367 domain-containing protein n=1 Tax=Pallidibacillus pasinlerensis TaxID=2703818 RepID=A0ABX0A145_9BACI|nr:DUF6612 family protein [Pallidibacillus pasinlerensis]NCU16299.1 hypothetical protein [Pallidibacillus pasinlerensis]
MKKFSLFFIGIFAIIALAACGKSLDKSEVLSKSIEESKKIESYSMDMTMGMEIMGMKQSIEITGDITNNPNTMYVKTDMGMLGMDFEVYANEDEAYMSMDGQWVKQNLEDLGMTGFEQINEEELEKLKKFEEHFEMEEEKDQYILTLSGDNEEYIELVEDYMFSSMGDDLAGDDEILATLMESLKINKFELVIYVDKETFHQTKETFNIELEIEESGMTMAMKMDGEVTLSNINKVDPIEIPAEVIENAVSEDEISSLFEDEFDSFVEETYTLDELKDLASYEIPEPAQLPDGYVFTEGYYEEELELVSLSYEKDLENWIYVEINPVDVYSLSDMEGDPITVNGSEGLLYEEEDFHSVMWEQDGLLVDLSVSSTELTTEQVQEIAESF